MVEAFHCLPPDGCAYVDPGFPFVRILLPDTWRSVFIRPIQRQQASLNNRFIRVTEGMVTDEQFAMYGVIVCTRAGTSVEAQTAPTTLTIYSINPNIPLPALMLTGRCKVPPYTGFPALRSNFSQNRKAEWVEKTYQLRGDPAPSPALENNSQCKKNTVEEVLSTAPHAQWLLSPIPEAEQ